MIYTYMTFELEVCTKQTECSHIFISKTTTVKHKLIYQSRPLQNQPLLLAT